MQEKYSNIITDFLKSHSLISVNALEEKLSIPQSTIGKALKETRLIPEKHIFSIICLLAGYGLKIDGYDLTFDDGILTGREWVENIKTKEVKGKDGSHFEYIVKEYRFMASCYFDLL